jgi:flavin reductase (DIM6/NTAB) family NADH-FMN oxidoreductase RutF
MPRKRKAEPITESPSSSKKSEQDNNNTKYPFEPYPPSKVYRLIEPGPVLLVSTGSLAESTYNLMTIGFHMMLQHDSPPLISACIGPWNTSFEALKESGECVLAIPDARIAQKVVDIGNCDGDEVDKWEAFGMGALPAASVKAPLVSAGDDGIIANVECVVVDRSMVKKYGLWVLKVVKAWVSPGFRETGRMFHHRGDGTFSVDGEVLDLQDRMVKWKEFQD